MNKTTGEQLTEICDQRDELLAACKAAEKKFTSMMRMDVPVSEYPIIEQLRAAIAKAEKGAA